MKEYKLDGMGGLIRTSDGASVSIVDGNRDYEAYKTWLAAGNTPEPAALPPQPSPQEQIDALEAQTMMPRVVREFMLTFMQVQFTPDQLAGNIGYTKVKALDDQIRVLRSQIK